MRIFTHADASGSAPRSLRNSQAGVQQPLECNSTGEPASGRNSNSSLVRLPSGRADRISRSGIYRQPSSTLPTVDDNEDATTDSAPYTPFEPCLSGASVSVSSRSGSAGAGVASDFGHRQELQRLSSAGVMPGVSNPVFDEREKDEVLLLQVCVHEACFQVQRRANHSSHMFSALKMVDCPINSRPSHVQTNQPALHSASMSKSCLFRLLCRLCQVSHCSLLVHAQIALCQAILSPPSPQHEQLLQGLSINVPL